MDARAVLVKGRRQGSDLPALLLDDTRSTALVVLAHGAGAGMHHDRLEELARAFLDEGLASLRFQFPFLLGPRRRPPGPPPRQVDAFLDAAAHAAGLAGGRALLYGGHSFGARVAALASAARCPAPEGVVCLSFPLHPPRSADTARFAVLEAAGVPVIVFQGERDSMGTAAELDGLARRCRGDIRVAAVEGVGHGFQPAARTGLRRAGVVAAVAGELAAWAGGLSGGGAGL